MIISPIHLVLVFIIVALAIALRKSLLRNKHLTQLNIKHIKDLYALSKAYDDFKIKTTNHKP